MGGSSLPRCWGRDWGLGRGRQFLKPNPSRTAHEEAVGAASAMGSSPCRVKPAAPKPTRELPPLSTQATRGGGGGPARIRNRRGRQKLCTPAFRIGGIGRRNRDEEEEEEKREEQRRPTKLITRAATNFRSPQPAPRRRGCGDELFTEHRTHTGRALVLLRTTVRIPVAAHRRPLTPPYDCKRETPGGISIDSKSMARH